MGGGEGGGGENGSDVEEEGSGEDDGKDQSETEAKRKRSLPQGSNREAHQMMKIVLSHWAAHILRAL